MAINTRTTRVLESNYIPLELPAQTFNVVAQQQARFNQLQNELQSFIPDFEANFNDFDTASGVRDRINDKVGGFIDDLKSTSNIREVSRKFSDFKKNLPNDKEIQGLAQRNTNFKATMDNITKNVRDPGMRQGLTSALQDQFANVNFRGEDGNIIADPSEGFLVADRPDIQAKMNRILSTVTPNQEATLGGITYARDPEGNLVGYRMVDGQRRYLAQEKLEEGLTNLLLNDTEVQNFVNASKQFNQDPTDSIRNAVQSQAKFSAFNQRDARQRVQFFPQDRGSSGGGSGYFGSAGIPGTTTSVVTNSAPSQTAQQLRSNIAKTKEHLNQFDYQVQVGSDTVALKDLINDNVSIPMTDANGNIDFSKVTVTDANGQQRELNSHEKNLFAADYNRYLKEVETANTILDRMNTPAFREELGLDENDPLTLETFDFSLAEKESMISRDTGVPTRQAYDAFLTQIEQDAYQYADNTIQFTPNVHPSQREQIANSVRKGRFRTYEEYIDEQFEETDSELAGRNKKIKERFDEEYADFVENNFIQNEQLSGIDLEIDLSDKRRAAMGDKAMAVDIANKQQEDINSSPISFLANFELMNERGERMELTQLEDIFLEDVREPGDDTYKGLVGLKFDLQDFVRSSNLEKNLRKVVAIDEETGEERPFFITGRDVDRAVMVAEGALSPVDFKNNLKKQFNNSNIVTQTFVPEDGTVRESHNFGYTIVKNGNDSYSISLMGFDGQGESRMITQEGLTLDEASDLLFSKFAFEQAKLRQTR